MLLLAKKEGLFQVLTLVFLVTFLPARLCKVVFEAFATGLGYAFGSQEHQSSVLVETRLCPS